LNAIIWEYDIEIPVEHQQLLLDSMKKAKLNPEGLLNWKEVSKKFVP